MWSFKDLILCLRFFASFTVRAYVREGSSHQKILFMDEKRKFQVEDQNKLTD